MQVVTAQQCWNLADLLQSNRTAAISLQDDVLDTSGDAAMAVRTRGGKSAVRPIPTYLEVAYDAGHCEDPTIFIEDVPAQPSERMPLHPKHRSSAVRKPGSRVVFADENPTRQPAQVQTRPTTVQANMTVGIRGWDGIEDTNFVITVELVDRLRNMRDRTRQYLEQTITTEELHATKGYVSLTATLPCAALLAPDAIIQVCLHATRTPYETDTAALKADGTRTATCPHRYIGRVVVFLSSLLLAENDRLEAAREGRPPVPPPIRVIYPVVAGKNCEDREYSDGHVRGFVIFTQTTTDATVMTEVPPNYLILTDSILAQLRDEERKAERRKGTIISGFDACPTTPASKNVYPLAFCDTGLLDSEQFFWQLQNSPFDVNLDAEKKFSAAFDIGLKQREFSERTLLNYALGKARMTKTPSGPATDGAILPGLYHSPHLLSFETLSGLELARLRTIHRTQGLRALVTETAKTMMLCMLPFTKYVVYLPDDAIIYEPGAGLGGVTRAGKIIGPRHSQQPWTAYFRPGDPSAPAPDPADPAVRMEMFMGDREHSPPHFWYAGEYYGNDVKGGDCEDCAAKLCRDATQCCMTPRVPFRNPLIRFCSELTNLYYDSMGTMVTAFAPQAGGTAAASDDYSGGSGSESQEGGEETREGGDGEQSADNDDADADGASVTGHMIGSLVPKSMSACGQAFAGYPNPSAVLRRFNVDNCELPADFANMTLGNVFNMEGTAQTYPLLAADPQANIRKVLRANMETLASQLSRFLNTCCVYSASSKTMSINPSYARSMTAEDTGMSELWHQLALPVRVVDGKATCDLRLNTAGLSGGGFTYAPRHNATKLERFYDAAATVTSIPLLANGIARAAILVREKEMGLPLTNFWNEKCYQELGGRMVPIDQVYRPGHFAVKVSLAPLLPACKLEQFPDSEAGGVTILPIKMHKVYTECLSAPPETRQESLALLAYVIQTVNACKAHKPQYATYHRAWSEGQDVRDLKEQGLTYAYRTGTLTKTWAKRVSAVLQRLPNVSRVAGYEERVNPALQGVVLVVFVVESV